MFKNTIYLTAFTLVILLAVACSGSPQAPATSAPAASPVASATSVASATPIAAATTAPVASTRAAPTPTVKPTTVPQSGAGPDGQAIAAAVAKTQAAAAFKASAKVSGSGTYVQIFPALSATEQIVLLGADGEFNGRDSHVKTTGIPAMLFSDDPSKGLETIILGSKTYVHGPAAAMDAPGDKWYEVSSGTTISISPMDLLDSFVSANGDWSKFKKARSGDKLDGRSCDVYSGDKDAVAASYAAMINDVLPPAVVDSGSVDLTICDDAYAHNLALSVQAHDKEKTASQGKVDFALHIFEIGSPIAIAAPVGAVPAPTSSKPAAAATPTRPAVNPGPASGPVNAEGTWEGTTTADLPISFTIEKNQITFANLSYSVRLNGCSISGSTSRSIDKAPITNNTFTIQLSDSDGRQYILKGALNSSTAAGGTIQVKGNSNTCGPYDDTANWNAEKNSDSQSGSIPSSPVVPPATGGASSASDSDVVKAFFDALNAKNVDAALAQADENVIYNIGATTGVGSAGLKTYLNVQLKAGASYQLSDVAEGIVGVNFKVKAGATNFTGMAIVDDGKISILKLQ